MIYYLHLFKFILIYNFPLALKSVGPGEDCRFKSLGALGQYFVVLDTTSAVFGLCISLRTCSTPNNSKSAPGPSKVHSRDPSQTPSCAVALGKWKICQLVARRWGGSDDLAPSKGQLASPRSYLILSYHLEFHRNSSIEHQATLLITHSRQNNNKQAHIDLTHLRSLSETNSYVNWIRIELSPTHEYVPLAF